MIGFNQVWLFECVQLFEWKLVNIGKCGGMSKMEWIKIYRVSGKNSARFKEKNFAWSPKTKNLKSAENRANFLKRTPFFCRTP
jgi:hypothetical protein